MTLNYKVFITLFLSVFVTTTGMGLVVPLLPVYAHELGAGSFQIGLIFGAFSLTRSLLSRILATFPIERAKKPF